MKKKIGLIAATGLLFLLLPHFSGAQTMGAGAVNPEAPGANVQPRSAPVLADYSVDKTDSTTTAETPRLAASSDEKKGKPAQGTSQAPPPKEN